jgi:hypothetical protein
VPLPKVFAIAGQHIEAIGSKSLTGYSWGLDGTQNILLSQILIRLPAMP